MAYWLDTDVFIQAKNKPYKFDRVPQFWTFLDEQLHNGVIQVSKLVYQELTQGNDHLAKWCKNRKPFGMCINPNGDVQKQYGEITLYVQRKYAVQHFNDFAQSADGWVIAHAMVDTGKVVSQEVNRTTKTAVKIPTICDVFDVPCMDTYDMLDELDFRI